MIHQPIQPSRSADEATQRFLNDLADWAGQCIARYGDAPASEVHDQGTYTTGWEPWLSATRDEAAWAFLRTTRDRIRDHFVSADRWRHGYWRMHEAHHGTEHFELFVGMLARLDGDDGATRAQLLDAAEHVAGLCPQVEPWLDGRTGLFRSTWFGTDGVRVEPGLEVNVPDHFRLVNLCLLAHDAGGGPAYLDLARAYARRWAEALLAEERLPVALAPAGALFDLTGQSEQSYRRFAGQMPANLDSPVDRAENLLASDATGALLTLGLRTGEGLFLHALRRLLDVLATQLADPDAASAVQAIRRYRQATGDDRYDDAVRAAGAQQGDPYAIEAMGLELDWKPAGRPGGIGKRVDMLGWREDGGPRRVGPALLALQAEIDQDEQLAARAVDLARAQFALARQTLPDGRHHGCAARTVSAVLRGHGRENGAGASTAVLAPVLHAFRR